MSDQPSGQHAKQHEQHPHQEEKKETEENLEEPRPRTSEEETVDNSQIGRPKPPGCEKSTKTQAGQEKGPKTAAAKAPDAPRKDESKIETRSEGGAKAQKKEVSRTKAGEEEAEVIMEVSEDDMSFFNQEKE